MVRQLLAASSLAALALGSFAAPASAIRPCELGEIECYKMCYLPHYDKPNGIYWVNC